MIFFTIAGDQDKTVALVKIGEIQFFIKIEFEIRIFDLINSAKEKKYASTLFKD